MEPNRLLIRSTGFGPQGAQKRLEMIVTKFPFGLDPPASIVIRGADDGTPSNISMGSSNSKFYTGEDNSPTPEPKRPTVAVNLQDWNRMYTAITKPNTVTNPQVSILDIDTIPTAGSWPSGNGPAPGTVLHGRIVSMPDSAVTPDFLVTADAARWFLDGLEAVARVEGRYFSSFSGDSDSNGSAAGGAPVFTFVDGNCTLSGGSGLLVVTGDLTLNGNADFQGIIMVMGNGSVTRAGGGNGNFLGAWVVARFNRTGTGGFLVPTFNVDGGGNGAFRFDSRYVAAANELLNRRVAGVAER